MHVPCQKCLPCKINKTSEWQMRILMELKTNPVASFVTLTYNNENLPKDRSLHKEELSAFNKAFRQDFDKPIKFFACGEYGDSPERLTYFGDDVEPELIKRPHYHSIMFGVDNSEKTRHILYDNWHKCDSYKFFGKNWFKTVGSVTPDSAAYVAGYCQKKLFGKMAEEEYGAKQYPFQLQSKRIGEEYFLQNIEQYKKDGFIYFRGSFHPIPKVWKDKFELEIPVDVMYENLKRQVEKYNEYHPNHYNFDELYKFLLQTYGLFEPREIIQHGYDYIQKDLEEQQTYSDYIDWKNNLRGKHNEKKRVSLG